MKEAFHSIFAQKKTLPKRLADHTDIHLLNLLQRDAETTFQVLSKKVGISLAAVFQRVKRLKEAGLLSDNYCELNKAALGYNKLYLVKISVPEKGAHVEKLEAYLLADQCVENLHKLQSDKLLGHGIYQALVRVQDNEQFKLWNEKLTEADGQKAIIETQACSEPLKSRSALKLTYQDLSVLKKTGL